MKSVLFGDIPYTRTFENEKTIELSCLTGSIILVIGKDNYEKLVKEGRITEAENAKSEVE